MLYMRQQNFYKQPVCCNMPYAIILPYLNISLEILLKLTKKTENTYLIVPDFMFFLPIRGCLVHSHYTFE